MSRRSTPPPLPREVLARTIRLASADGRLVLWLSGLCAVFAAAGHEVIGAIAGCAAAGAGAVELHGSTLLRQEDPRGVDWLIRGQLLLLAVILIYAAARLNLVDASVETLRERITPDMDEKLAQLGATREQVLQSYRTLHQLFYSLVGFVALIYQGAMARYYARRRATIHQALQEHEAT